MSPAVKLRMRVLMKDGVAEGIHDVQVEGTFPVSSNCQS